MFNFEQLSAFVVFVLSAAMTVLILS